MTKLPKSIIKDKILIHEEFSKKSKYWQIYDWYTHDDALPYLFVALEDNNQFYIYEQGICDVYYGGINEDEIKLLNIIEALNDD